ncbi:UPF0262 family protein [Sinorhizobium americanum]|uniref:Uncharacterized protein (UPF0262 family) n=1 Tax=Sinorhizobium americanum TaxID=194963 RepID=A0A4R2AVT0_9HYPH|nr:UPF0262 family protein [Sinorhizobium americanum]TCN17981.1 uncharacterized protein (UPF0262 family) [Sinorhizobium americanum]
MHKAEATQRQWAQKYQLYDVSLERSLGGSDARLEREQAIAMIDLLEKNTFAPLEHSGGPYRLSIATADTRLALHITTDRGAHVLSHFLSLAPFRRLIKDYAGICASYYDTIAGPGSDRLEAIDMSRRVLHDEAAGLLRERLSSTLTVDHDTARRLFTLIYVLVARDAPYRILS